MPEKTDIDAGHWMMPLGIDAMMQMQRPTLSAMAEVNTETLREHRRGQPRVDFIRQPTPEGRSCGAPAACGMQNPARPLPGLRAVLPERMLAVPIGA